MAENSTKPKIRFKGFSDDWEPLEFRDLGSVAMNKRIFKDQTSEAGDVPFYKIGTFGGKPDAFISRQLFEEYKTKFSYPRIGDILLSASGSIGRIVEYTGADEYFQDSNIVWLEHDERLDNLFLKHFYSIVKWQGLEGSTIKRLYNKNILDTEINLPSIDEQIKVGNFFKGIDNLINLHQRKYDKLVNIKKAMLEKMFPKNGSRVPEIRFKGFTDDWEQHKLIDKVQITMGQSPDGSTYSDIPSDHILVQGNADLQNGWVVPRIWTTQITKKAEAGDLIMSVRAPAGTMGKTNYDVVIGRGVAAIKGNEFIYQLLVKMDTNGYWKKLSCGSTFESLNSENIKNAEILIPGKTEQQKIGAFFKDLDGLIALHQRKYDKLINIKKAMLEKMFV